MTKAIATKEQLSSEISDTAAAAALIVVKDEHSREKAVKFCQQIRSAKERVEEVLGGQVKAAHAAWKTALDMKNRFIKPLDQADRVVKSKITEYELEMERIEKKLREEALLKQQQEEAKLLKSLDRKMVNAEKKGDLEKMEMLEEERSGVVVPIEEVKPVLTKLKGKSSQDDYVVEVVNIKKLLAAVISGQIPIALDKLITVKTGTIKAFVKATGILQVPGCVITKTKIQRLL